MTQMYCEEGRHEVKVRSNAAPGERVCPDHGCELRPIRKQSNRDELPGEKMALARFKFVVCERRCFFLDVDEAGDRRRPDHTCRYPLDPHHLIPVQWMKRELSLPPEELVALISNPLLGAPLCRKAHDAVEYSPDEHIYRDELNPDLVAFCERFDVEHPGQRSLLEQLYLRCPVREEQPTHAH